MGFSWKWSWFSRRNVPAGTKLTCRYDKDKDPNCPIIRLGTILDNLSDDVSALFDQVISVEWENEIVQWMI